MAKKKQNKAIQLLVVMLVGAGGGFLLTYGTLHWMPDSIAQLFKSAETTGWEKLLKLSMAFVAIWAALAAHELGHLLMGLWQGFSFHLYVAGFLGVRRNPINDQVEWYFNRDPNLFGGVAATIPTEKSTTLTKKLAAVVAAGPLTSLAGAMLLLFPLFLASTNPQLLVQSVASRLFFSFLLVFGLCSFLLFLATTLPKRTGPFFTDRARFFRLIGGGKAAAIEQAVLELMAQSYSQQPYREIDPAQIALIESDDSELMKIFAYSLRYYHHLDRGEKEKALAAIQTMEPLLEDQPVTFRVVMQKDLVYATAILAQDPAKAREIWNKMGKLGQDGKDMPSLLAKAALLAAEGKNEESREVIQQGLKTLSKGMQKYSDRFYAGLLQQLEIFIGHDLSNLEQ